MSYMKKVVLDENKNTINTLDRDANNYQNIMPVKNNKSFPKNNLSYGENNQNGK